MVRANYTGSLGLPGQPGSGLGVSLVLEDRFLTVTARGDTLGEYPIEKVNVERTSGDRFRFKIGNEEFDFIASDPVRFFYDAVPEIERAGVSSTGARSLFNTLLGSLGFRKEEPVDEQTPMRRAVESARKDQPPIRPKPVKSETARGSAVSMPPPVGRGSLSGSSVSHTNLPPLGRTRAAGGSGSRSAFPPPLSGSRPQTKRQDSDSQPAESEISPPYPANPFQPTPGYSTESPNDPYVGYGPPADLYQPPYSSVTEPVDGIESPQSGVFQGSPYYAAVPPPNEESPAQNYPPPSVPTPEWVDYSNPTPLSPPENPSKESAKSGPEPRWEEVKPYLSSEGSMVQPVSDPVVYLGVNPDRERLASAPGGPSGTGFAYDPAGATERRLVEEKVSETASRARDLHPDLEGLVIRLETAVTQVHEGILDPPQALAMASLVQAMCDTLSVAEKRKD